MEYLAIILYSCLIFNLAKWRRLNNIKTGYCLYTLKTIPFLFELIFLFFKFDTQGFINFIVLTYWSLLITAA
ncbi:putative membrane protein [Desulfosporosinus sp. OT]|nr:putative membrane protein [Desulfosporosinus sp. OT]